MTSRDDRSAPVPGTTEDVPDWGSAAPPARELTGLPGNPGFLHPHVPAFAVRDRRGRPVVETPLTPRPAARHRAALVVTSGLLTAAVTGVALTLLAGHLLGDGALPGGRPAPWWLVAVTAALGLVACFLLLGAHTVTLGLTGSAAVASAVTWSTLLLGVAAGTGAVVALDLAGASHPLVHALEPAPRGALAVVTALGVAGAAAVVVAGLVARRAAHAVQERLRALRRDGVRSPGRLEAVTYRGAWSDDGRPRLDVIVAYGTPGAERRVPLLLVTPQHRVPLVGAPVVVTHEQDPARAEGADGTAPGAAADAPEPDLVLVELDQSRPVDYDPDVAAYARAD